MELRCCGSRQAPPASSTRSLCLILTRPSPLATCTTHDPVSCPIFHPVHRVRLSTRCVVSDYPPSASCPIIHPVRRPIIHPVRAAFADEDAWRRDQELTPTSAAALVVCTQRCYSSVAATTHHGLHPANASRLASIEAPPYAIANGNSRLPLGTHTVSPTASHYDGTLEYDAHSVYGLSEALATSSALDTINPGQRHFILTRCPPRCPCLAVTPAAACASPPVGTEGRLASGW